MIKYLILFLIVVGYIGSAIYNYKFFKDNRYAYPYYDWDWFAISPYILMPIVNWVITMKIMNLKNNK